MYRACGKNHFKSIRGYRFPNATTPDLYSYMHTAVEDIDERSTVVEVESGCL
jgi:hypothetical protein